MNDNTSVLYPTAAWVRGAYIILAAAITYGMAWSGRQARAAVAAAWRPLRDALRWLRGWWHSRHPLHKAPPLFLDAGLEQYPSKAFRSSFDPPWEPAQPPARVAPTMVPHEAEDAQAGPYGFLPPEPERGAAADVKWLAGYVKDMILPKPAPEPEPAVPPGELAPWVLAELTRQHDPDANLDSIVARVVRGND